MTSVSTDRRQGVNSGAALKVPCRATSTGNLTLSGEQTIDGIACVTGDRVLVKNQTSGAQNGIYIVDTGTWGRAPDWDGAYDVVTGTAVYITSGSSNAGTYWAVTTTGTITVGTTSVAFTNAVISSAASISTIQSGTGAVSTTVQERLQQTVSLLDFIPTSLHAGILAGTNTTNLQSYILAAVTASSSVWCPRGTYQVSGQTVLPANTHIFGDGKEETIFQQTGVVNGSTGTYYAVFQINAVSNVSITDLQIKGENTTPVAIALGPQAPGIAWSDSASSTDGLVARCKLQNFFGAGAQSTGACLRINYLDNVSINNGENGLNCSGVNNIIARNHCRGNKYNGIESTASYCTITGNVCLDNTKAGITVVGSGTTGHGSTVTANECNTNQIGISLSSTKYGVYCANTVRKNTDVGINLTLSTDNLITNNKALSNGLTAGATKLGILDNGSCTNNRYLFNDIIDVSETGYQHQFGMQINSANCEVRGNRSIGASAWDYDIGSAATGTIFDNAWTTSLIRFQAGCTFNLPSAPATETGATRMVGFYDNTIIANRAGTVTLTLPAVSTGIGRKLRVVTIQAQTVVSATSNVVPLAGGSAGTAILAATAGKWADLECDGTNWIITASN